MIAYTTHATWFDATLLHVFIWFFGVRASALYCVGAFLIVLITFATIKLQHYVNKQR